MAELKNILAALPDPLPRPTWHAREFPRDDWEARAPLQQMLVIQEFGASGERALIKPATQHKTSSWRDLIESAFAPTDTLGLRLIKKLDSRQFNARGQGQRERNAEKML